MAERTAGSLDAEFAPARAASVYSVEIDGELVLLDEHEDRLHHLNPTASLVWSCFDGEARVRDLARDISGELGLSYELILTDTVRIVRELGAEGLLDGVAADERPDPGPE
jgi:Coenzyme PQQ synthesis protein D (PqqD)